MDWTFFNNDGENDKQFNRLFTVLFHRPSNYTKVLVKESDRPEYIYKNTEILMDKLSDHDSCWKSDGLRWIFKAYVDAWNYFKKYGIEGRDINPFVCFDISGNPAYWKVELKPERQENGYIMSYNVKFIEQIKIKNVEKYFEHAN
jgi:hypothetical protein